MPIYPGDPSPSFEHYSTLEKDGVNLTKITMGSHTGTHLDAPRHFIQDGIGIDRIPPDKLIGEAYVADLSRKPIGSGITSQDLKRDLEEKIASDDIVVIYTGCSEHSATSRSIETTRISRGRRPTTLSRKRSVRLE